ncbi:hypothetical protein, partial [Thiocapsa roseopersicina]
MPFCIPVGSGGRCRPGRLGSRRACLSLSENGADLLAVFVGQVCVFRPNPATHSDLKRPPILVQTGHSFRFKPAT